MPHRPLPASKRTGRSHTRASITEVMVNGPHDVFVTRVWSSASSKVGSRWSCCTRWSCSRSRSSIRRFAPSRTPRTPRGTPPWRRRRHHRSLCRCSASTTTGSREPPSRQGRGGFPRSPRRAAAPRRTEKGTRPAGRTSAGRRTPDTSTAVLSTPSDTPPRAWPKAGVQRRGRRPRNRHLSRTYLQHDARSGVSRWIGPLANRPAHRDPSPCLSMSLT